MPLTDEQLADLVAAPESYRLERKSSFTKGDSASIRKTICAFANDLPGSGEPGHLLLGVADDGSLVGFEADDQTLRQLAQMTGDGSMLPPFSTLVESRSVGGKAIVVVEVQPNPSPPVRWDGYIWVRSGPLTQKATRSDEIRLSERRRFLDQPFDARPVNEANLSHLDLTYFEGDLWPAVVAPEVVDENDRTIDQKLASQKFATSEGIPTVAGILTLGRLPRQFISGAYVQYTRFEGTEVDTPIRDQVEIGGRLAEVIADVEARLRASNESPLVQGVSSFDIHPKFPEETIREIVRNAILHRSYEGTRAPVRIESFADRLVIQSPGGLYGNAVRSLGEQPDYRNPAVWEAMKALRLVNKAGLGLRIARSAMTRNGNPPLVLEAAESFVRVTLPARMP